MFVAGTGMQWLLAAGRGLRRWRTGGWMFCWWEDRDLGAVQAGLLARGVVPAGAGGGARGSTTRGAGRSRADGVGPAPLSGHSVVVRQ